MANLTNSAKLINEMSKKADKTELPAVYDSTVTVVVNGNTGSNTFTTNQAANSTLKVTVGKSDVGLGNVDNTSDANKPISTATQAALDLKADKSEISSVYKYKGSKANYDALPSSGNVTGDVWNVEAAHTTAPIFPAGSNLAWDGSAWDVLGGTVDLSGYVTLSTAQTISGTKTFSAEPVLPAKTAAAGANSTKPATEYQVSLKANTSDVLTKTNTSSYTPSANYHPATKKYVDDRDTYIGSSQPTSNKVEGRLWYDTTNDQLKVYDGSQWQVTYKEYNAGPGISIGNYTDYSAMRGPAPKGFHVPSNTEWQAVCDIWTTLGGGSSDGTNFGIALKLPFAGVRNSSSAIVSGQGSQGNYWSTSRKSNNHSAYYLLFGSNTIGPNYATYSASGYSVRPFKDEAVTPDNSWTTLYNGSSVASGAGIFHNSTLGLISVSGDGNTWITIADKNLGATTVWNNGDTLSEANCGGYFQWGNNYMFPRTGSVTTSSTQVDASNYGPGNYYNSSTFITYSGSWDSTNDGNLWGGETGVVTLDNAITNTGVLSVNGQTGDVTIQGGGGHDYSWETATISSGAVTLGLRTIVEPTSNFTLNAPSDLQDGMEYVLRCVNGSTAYTLTLGTGFVNDFSTDLTLHANHSDQFTFVAVDGSLELQPEYALYSDLTNKANASDVLTKTNTTSFTPTGDYQPATKKYVDDNAGITNDTTGTTTTVQKIWAGTEAEFNTLTTKSGSTIYHVY